MFRFLLAVFIEDCKIHNFCGASENSQGKSLACPALSRRESQRTGVPASTQSSDVQETYNSKSSDIPRAPS